MNTLFDTAAVALILIASTAYAAAALGPRIWRRRLLEASALAALRAPKFLRLAAAARRLQALARRGGGVCGGCDSCGPAVPPAQPAEPTAETRVPLERIARRR